MGSRGNDDRDSNRYRKHGRSRKSYSKGRSSSSSGSDSDDNKTRDRNKRTHTSKHTSSKSKFKGRRRYFSKHSAHRSSSRSTSLSPDRNINKERRPESNSKGSSRSSRKVVDKFDAKADIIMKNSLSENDELKRIKAIDEINADGFHSQVFVPKKERDIKDVSDEKFTFGTSGEVGLEKPNVEASKEISSTSFMHLGLFADQEQRFDRWVKKLYMLRQKNLHDL